MRLLHVVSFEFELFENDPPPYAILSHRWTKSEASLAEIKSCHGKVDRTRYPKVFDFAQYVRSHLNLEWIWVDSCCINQDSAAELSEAVNRMFSWYKQAHVCLAYLPDVAETCDIDAFEQGVWFTRGWTLQEMLASRAIVFLTNTWQVIGHKGKAREVVGGNKTGPNLERHLSAVTGVPEDVLEDFEVSKGLSVEDKLLWMKGRKTKKEEDLVYALFGIFGVTPGANYGEGQDEATSRLMKAVELKEARGSHDGTLATPLASDYPHHSSQIPGFEQGRTVNEDVHGMGETSQSPNTDVLVSSLPHSEQQCPQSQGLSVIPEVSIRAKAIIPTSQYPVILGVSSTVNRDHDDRSQCLACMSQEMLDKLFVEMRLGLLDCITTQSQAAKSLSLRIHKVWYQNPAFRDSRPSLYVYCAPSTWHVILGLYLASDYPLDVVIRVDPALSTAPCTSHHISAALGLQNLINLLEKHKSRRVSNSHPSELIPRNSLDVPWLQSQLDQLEDEDDSIVHNSLSRYVSYANHDRGEAAVVLLSDKLVIEDILSTASILHKQKVHDDRLYRLEYVSKDESWIMVPMGKM